MPRISFHLTLPVLCLLVSACATPRQRASAQEDVLAATGFTKQPANTPERAASLGSLPPNMVVQQAGDGPVRYVYADPLVCKCLYFGDQAAYERYNQEAARRRVAVEQAQAAQLKQSTWDEHPF